ncbi:MAG TPA: ABC transporter permease [Candidatus Acidoferrum sp.]|nr:ABC transporter permease [Candidatus Acidoferrum sp.]
MTSPDSQQGSFQLFAWLESLRADAVYGWRQLKKHKVTSTAAILSLALGIGACTPAFRLIDALLLRPLPVTAPERLYFLSRQGPNWDGKPNVDQNCEYPLFLQMRATVKDRAELLVFSYVDKVDLSFGSDQEIEKAHLQYFSGWMFEAFGLRPALGRVLTESDEQAPGAHPYAVLSYDYWSRRFGQDRKVIGRSFRMGETLYQIIGVADKQFTGTEPGTFVDIFVPAMMHPYVTRPDASVFRVFAQLKPGVVIEPVRAKLQANSRGFEEDRAKGFVGMPKQSLKDFLNQKLLLEPAPTGVSDLQNDNRRSLAALGVLVALVSLIACANVANLMTAQAAARAHEMALRISIGAGRRRLVQMMLIESAWIALLAAAIGAFFAWWSAPFVVGRINPPDDPVRLILPADWRVWGFALALTVGVTMLFGLLPALRVSAIKPLSAVKGKEEPQSRRGLMHALIASQVAFCFLVLFATGLFVATFQRLSHQPLGFSGERLLTLDTFARQPQPPALWAQVAEHLRQVQGVEKVAFASWALLDGNSVNSYISVNGAPPIQRLAYFLRVSPGWIDTMKIALIEGRDFLPRETAPGAAIVNETFAQTYFKGEDPVGKAFARSEDNADRRLFRIVGFVRDPRYGSVRETPLPVVYVPFQGVRGDGSWLPENWGTFIVRTSSANPLALAQTLRQEVPRARPEFRVSRIRTQLEINQAQTVRERLLAMLAVFFGGVALVLAGVGLYGVLHYSVLQRQREIGIRMALGAQAAAIVRIATFDVFSMILLGAVAGLGLGMAFARYVEALFYQVKSTDLGMLAFPSLTLLAVALLASLAPVIRAVQIDPATMLRAE